MLNTSARLLALLSALATRPSWTCGQLAAHLDVTERTVRRDIARLRELGYGIESEPGPWGGYRLGPGRNVPPLILDEEEALSVAVGLRAAAFGGIDGSDQAALSALLKLRQILPKRVARRIEELESVLTHTEPPEERVSPKVLLLLATACRAGERVQLSYRDRHGVASTRRVDPHRLVHTGRRWYLVAFDGERRDWRTFRGDRISNAKLTGRPVELTERPDAAGLVSRGMAAVPYPVRVRFRLFCPLAEALRRVPATIGVHEPDGDQATIVEVGGPDADGLARFLLRLGMSLEILEPDEVRAAFRALLRALLDANQ
ncbi:YafY family transcriptional regulator [Amycolatopsis rhizosphaerae]|uniref:YafY family transcriptional regulator n=1 Tax=Amycolatopsis rhizosphaerae TaxID=2053003 RepID=A0A558DBQ5_9PSEU|nr:YafY family protein [Amycolatopsis rhizosphaerae]TVT58450.1 YafY family transcriptional regulator [Amycolatopsis rhizosphaerae]